MTMKVALLATFTLLTPLTTAQEGTILDPARLPSCAFSCGTLISAQSLCVPPIAPPQGQAIYQTCFCNSNYLAGYKAGAASPACDDVCTSNGDRQAILQWYTGLCTGGVVVVPQGNAANPGAADPAATAGAPGSTATSSSGSSGSSQQSGSGAQKSW